MGSPNSFKVGKYVGHSSRPNSRGDWRGGCVVGGPRGIDEKSSASLLGTGRSTEGIFVLAEGAEGGKVLGGGELARLMAARASVLDLRAARLEGIGTSP